MMLVAGFLNTVCTLSIGHSSYQCLQCVHYCDYPHPLTTQLTINQHDAPCPAPGRLGGCGRQWPRESVTFEANQNCSRLFPSVEKIFSQRGKLVGNYVSCCGPADGTVTASRSPRVSPAFLATESRHMEQTGLKMSGLPLLVTAGLDTA